MKLVLETEDVSHYLGSDALVQSDAPGVVALARSLRDSHSADFAFAQASFEWVRDHIAHSYDAQDRRVTLAASDVLRETVGLCYAKSVLLAAILRAQAIPTGLCYQRLGNSAEGFVVHGLVAIWLDGAWHRQDPRGNKPGIDAQFSLGEERLAYQIDVARGEADYRRLYSSVPSEIVAVLSPATNILDCELPGELAE
ncbi:transglutaminase family protein [Microbacterium sp. p3-SID336]|uniref:transglutaminase-like domain-containing protein n=1 Tax=Microbacterium sp. p3-SID336 TaxID=2916212 RepID=UPI0021A6ADFF|nr:transglutaminase family protein [Microbacterium sp. p3-SID336]MCT1479116.1 transglutaminase family protein [Microbacterium sp. p3-SID336]